MFHRRRWFHRVLCRTLDNDKIDQAVAALLYLGIHDIDRAWKGFDYQRLGGQ